MKEKKVISFGLLATAFIFFCNPNINIFDFLPDSIACLFIILAIRRLSDLYDSFADAKAAFTKLFWIYASRLPALFLVALMTTSSMDQGSMWLTAAFVYAVLEMIFAVSAFKKLFYAFTYLGSREDGGEFLYIRTVREPRTLKNGKVKRGKYKRIESVEFFTSLFIFVRAACYTLPEISQLYTHDSYGFINPTGYALIDFRPLLMFVGWVVATAFGIILGVKAVAYVRSVCNKKRSEFWRGVKAHYDNTVLTRNGLFVMRKVRLFAVLICLATLFSVDLYLDDINVIPDFVSALLFFAAACAVDNYCGKTAALKVSSIVYFILSTVTYITMLGFKTDYSLNPASTYTAAAVHKVSRAKELYSVYSLFNTLTMVAFIAVMMAVVAIMMRIVREHTGVNTLTGVTNRLKPLINVYKRRAWIVRVFSVISALVSVFYFYAVVDVVRVPLRTGGVMYQPAFSGVWMVDFGIEMLFAVCVSVFLFDLSSEVDYKYKYE